LISRRAAGWHGRFVCHVRQEFDIGLALSVASVLRAADLPKTVDSSPCAKPPVIDGVLGIDEWKNVPVLKLDLSLVALKPPLGVASTPAELLVMNSTSPCECATRRTT
jgi:hypothetical protein